MTIKALAFDAYGTIFDVHSVIALCDQLFPGRGQALSQQWRTKQLEYTWLRSLMGAYVDFWQVTESGLLFACKALGLELTADKREQLMNAYLHLTPYPDVAPALGRMAHLPLAILSNGAPRMLHDVVANANLSRHFQHLLSVDSSKNIQTSCLGVSTCAEHIRHQRGRNRLRVVQQLGCDRRNPLWLPNILDQPRQSAAG